MVSSSFLSSFYLSGSSSCNIGALLFTLHRENEELYLDILTLHTTSLSHEPLLPIRINPGYKTLADGTLIRRNISSAIRFFTITIS
jgi:hypothetical protein